jgi:hypothetical protein
MVYKNKELEAPNCNNRYCQTKERLEIRMTRKGQVLDVYVDKTKAMLVGIRLDNRLASGV